jgi:hypothetical protein
MRWLVGLSCCALLAVAGCERLVRVPLAPPPLNVEAVPQPPGPNYVWIPGRWVWDQRYAAWTWKRGFHSWKPAHASGYQPGHWARRGYYWVWIPGRWIVAAGQKSAPAPRSSPDR